MGWYRDDGKQHGNYYLGFMVEGLGFRENLIEGNLFGGPDNKLCSILGCILQSPYSKATISNPKYPKP